MIRLKDVEMEYPNGTRAIRGISTTIEDGEFVFLVGPSGSGKSTIIKMLTGEEIPTAGRIMINGFSVNNIAERQIPMMRRTLGIIFQDFRLIEKKTVYENLEFVMRAVGMPMKEIKNRIAYVLLLVGLEQKAESYPNELSGVLEITSIVGNVSEMNGEVYLHIHATFGDQAGHVFGGHLNEATISATGEIFIHTVNGHIGRFHSDEIGLNLLDL